MDKEELIKKVKSLKAQLQLIVMEYDDVELKEATAIRVEYTEKIGQYECRQYELYLRYEELKCKIEMVQARINRGEEIDINAINNEVANTLSAYYEKLNGMREDVIEYEGFRCGVEVGVDVRADIKRVYRRLMKILHPDVLGADYDFDQTLWEKAQDAYKRNDIDTLLMIDDIVGECDEVSEDDKEESELIDMVNRMELAIERYKMKLVEIKKRFPFTEVEHLRNDAWVNARQMEINASIEEYEKSIVFLAAALNSLVGESMS